MTLVLASTSYAQVSACTPDATIPADSLGLTPDTLAYGQVGVPYVCVIDIVMPQDTTVAGIGTLKFCYFQIASIQTMAGADLSTALGLNNACGGAILDATTPCKWNVNHTPGFVNRGCVKISGTPTAVYDDSVVVNVNAGVGSVIGTNCITATTYPVPYRTYLKIIPANGIVGATAAKLRMKLVPNPTVDASMLSFFLPSNANVNVEVLDMTGKKIATIFNGFSEKGMQNYAINTSDLASGLYNVKVTLDNGASIINQTLAVQP